MPLKPDQIDALRARLHLLDPNVTLLQPEDPGFPALLHDLSGRDPALARDINAAVEDSLEQETRDMFSKSAGVNMSTLTRNIKEGSKGRSVRGEKRIRPATLGAIAAGAIGLVFLITAFVPEERKPTPVAANPDAQETVTVATRPQPPATTLPTSTVDPVTSETPTSPLPEPGPVTPTDPAPNPVAPEPPAPAPLTPPPPVIAEPAPPPPAVTPPPPVARVPRAPDRVVVLPPPAAIVSNEREPAPKPSRAVVDVTGAQPVRPAAIAQRPVVTPERSAVVSSAREAPTAPRSGVVSASASANAAPQAVVASARPETNARSVGLVSSAQATSSTPTGLSGESAQPAAASAFVSTASPATAPAATGMSASVPESPATPAAPAPETPPVGLAMASTRATGPRPGSVTEVKLETGAALLTGMSVPVWATAQDGAVWRGEASLDERAARVFVKFTQVLPATDGVASVVNVNAYAESADGPGLGGKMRAVTKDAARAAINGLLGATVEFVKSQAARTTVAGPGGFVTTSERPQNFWLALGGGVANAFQIPDLRAQTVQLAELKAGETVRVRVDFGAGAVE